MGETPDGRKEPVELVVGPDNKTIMVSFMPTVPGVHKVFILRNGKPVNGGPFNIRITKADIIAADPQNKGQKPGVGDRCAIEFDSLDFELPKDFKDLKATL